MKSRALEPALACLVALALSDCGPHASNSPKPAAASAAPRPTAHKNLRLLDAARTRAVDDFARDAATRLQVPGAAIAIVVDGAVVHETVIGVRAIGASEAVDPSTLFMIGSMTKPLTTLMEAVLVDAGKVSWDTPLTTLYPSFAVDDPERTRQLVLWHASCACSGLGSQDVEGFFDFADATPETRIEAMRRMKPSAPLGAKYQYSNAMVALGGFAAAHAANPNLPLAEAYARTLKSTVLDPIGMSSSTLDFDLAERVDHAMPHAAAIDGTVTPIPLAYERNVVPIAPSGSVLSNLRDMERYVITEMNDGVTPEGKRIVSKQNIEERRKLRIHTEGDDGYGLGLDVGSYDGMPSYGHDGGALGYGTSMLVLPQEKAAIVILTNVRNGGPFAQLPFNRVVEKKIVEALVEDDGDKATPMLESFVIARSDLATKLTQGLERDPPQEWVRSIAGNYKNPILGTVTIRTAAHGGVLDVGEWKSAFGRRVDKDGSAKIVLVDPPLAGGAIGVKDSTLIVETSSGDLVLQRTP